MADPAPAPVAVAAKVDIVVIGAGQAGLSAAYWLGQRGITPGRGYVVLDHAPRAGGAWQHRWPSLTLSTTKSSLWREQACPISAFGRRTLTAIP